ncbi:Sodium/hydrogen exchanger family-domain-containing protein [Suillus bovinus]|uniref:Sodium/hydrogen exchanger family-domain-containing protein n=1 Tax=Suillus bovinus TaxID=48563 RepID=UPI001B8696E4|nr:Sodium/hydrogen exchanger family-domain-containing protein [Suillus bovinus]KAG2132016.1 Sodium/hydrogen exchanger family-domain-containing protein [Suillus bovinus]
MDLDLLQVSPPSLAYICLGGFVVLFSMISLLVKEKLYINEVVLGTGFGVIIGPYVANVFTPRTWGALENTITLEVMRIVLATGLFAVGVELPCAYMKEHAKSLLVIVVPTMAFGWVVVAAVIQALFPELNYISSLCIAACLTPTDPVTCAAITRGKFATKHVPVNIRRILSAESAANDGLAYPFLAISIYLTVETSVRTAFGKWFLVGWLYQVILGTVLGAVLGLLFSKLMKISHNRGFIDRESYVAQYLALSIFTIGIASTIGADDLLAAFAAGSAISWDGHFNVQTENDVFSSVIDYVLNCGCFIYIGAWLPLEAYNSPEYGITPWRLVLLVIVILVLRRIPPLLALYKFVPEIATWKEALFSGHFGPMGVSAVFVSALALTRLPTPEHPPANQAQYLAATIQPIVSFVVLGSIIVHGLSIPFFNIGRGVRSRTVSLTTSWTSRNRVIVPDWILWARRAPDIVESAVDEDVERGSTKTPKDTVESTVDIPVTGPPGVVTFQDVLADIDSVMTRRHGRSEDDFSPELVQVDTVNKPPGPVILDNGALDDNRIQISRFAMLHTIRYGPR